MTPGTKNPARRRRRHRDDIDLRQDDEQPERDDEGQQQLLAVAQQQRELGLRLRSQHPTGAAGRRRARVPGATRPRRSWRQAGWSCARSSRPVSSRKTSSRLRVRRSSTRTPLRGAPGGDGGDELVVDGGRDDVLAGDSSRGPPGSPGRSGPGPASAGTAARPAALGELRDGPGRDHPAGSMTTTSSASRSASSSRWVVSTTVTPSRPQRLDQLPGRVPGLRVEAGGRLVEEDQLRAGRRPPGRATAAAAGRRTGGGRRSAGPRSAPAARGGRRRRGARRRTTRRAGASPRSAAPG